MRPSVTLLLVVVLLVSPLSVTTAAAEDPTFGTTVPEPVVTPGSTQELSFQLTNDAGPDEFAETARNVEVSVDGGETPITVDSGPRTVGTMRDDDSRTVSVRLSVPQDIEAGSYRLPVEVRYEHDDEVKTETVHVTVRVEDRAYFRVENVESSVAVGDTGTVSVTMTNVGTENASMASVDVTAQSSEVTLGQASSASQFAGEWAPNETRTLTYELRASEDAGTHSYTLQTRVTYDDASGRTRQSQPFRFGVTPAPEQTFDLSNVETTLRVGEDGTLSGTVTNTGPRPAEGVVLTFQPGSETVSALEPEVAVGELGPGESANFSFEVTVSESGSAGPRQFDVGVSYRNQAGESRNADDQPVRVEVAPEQPQFGVSPINASFEAGSGGTLTVELTNRGEEPVDDVSAKLYAGAPLSTGNDEAFVAELGPGESVELTFGLSAAGDALAKTYPVKLDFRYGTPDGDTRISDTYQLPVTVQEPSNGDLPVVAIAVVAVLALLGLAGGYRYLRG